MKISSFCVLTQPGSLAEVNDRGFEQPAFYLRHLKDTRPASNQGLQTQVAIQALA